MSDQPVALTPTDYAALLGDIKQRVRHAQTRAMPAVSQHLKRTYADNELEREATVKPYLMVQTEGEREVQRKVDHYSLQAKNYLTEHEMAQLQRLVSAYLDVAEDMALRKIPMTMQDWEKRLNRFIEATDRDVLQDAGKVTAEIAKAHAMSEFEKYRIVQDRLFESDFDRVIKQIESGSEPDIAEE